MYFFYFGLQDHVICGVPYSVSVPSKKFPAVPIRGACESGPVVAVKLGMTMRCLPEYSKDVRDSHY